MSKIIGLAAVLVLMIAAPAAAQTSPTQDAYGGAAGEVAGVSERGSAPDRGVAGVDRTPAGEGGVRGVSEGGGSAPDTGAARPSAGTPVSQPLATSDRLPFTGLDVGFMAAGSLLLVTLGFMLRWLGRPSAPLA